MAAGPCPLQPDSAPSGCHQGASGRAHAPDPASRPIRWQRSEPRRPRALTWQPITGGSGRACGGAGGDCGSRGAEEASSPRASPGERLGPDELQATPGRRRTGTVRTGAWQDSNVCSEGRREGFRGCCPAGPDAAPGVDGLWKVSVARAAPGRP